MNIPEDEFGFDVSYGYGIEKLLKVGSPDAPKDFSSFWKSIYEECRLLKSKPQLIDTGGSYKGWNVFDLEYRSTNSLVIRGWVLIPQSEKITRGFVITHGYGGRESPDYHLPFKDAVLFFPCLRGLGKSVTEPYSEDPQWHVLHDIDKKDNYIMRGCVEDVWQCVDAMIRLFPQLENHIGYLGESFGGGIGALALPWDDRIKKGHLCVPTFGNHPLRVSLPCTGSGASITNFYKEHGDSLYETLNYYDAAIAAPNAPPASPAAGCT